MAGFDDLYNLRNQTEFLHPNPMLRDPENSIAESLSFLDLRGVDIGTVGTIGSSTVSNDNIIEVSGTGSGELYYKS